MATAQDDMPDLEDADDIVSFGGVRDCHMICEEIRVKTEDGFQFKGLCVNTETGDPDGSKRKELAQKMLRYMSKLGSEYPGVRIVTGPSMGRGAIEHNNRIWLDISDCDIMITPDCTRVDVTGDHCIVVVGRDREGSLENVRVQIRHKIVSVHTIYLYLAAIEAMPYRSRYSHGASFVEGVL